MIKKAKSASVPLQIFVHAERMSWDANCVFLTARLGVARAYSESAIGFDEVPTKAGRLRIKDLGFTLVLSRDSSADNHRGATLEYRDVHTVSLHGAKEMARTLETIGRAFERLRDRFGYPESFGAWFRRACDVLGVQDVVFSGQLIAAAKLHFPDYAVDSKDGSVTRDVDVATRWLGQAIEEFSAPTAARGMVG